MDTPYMFPKLIEPQPVAAGEVLLVASGDLRQSANEVCWPAQAEMENQIGAAFAAEGFTLRRAHGYDTQLKHGFICNQRMGMDVFANIHPEALIVVAEAVWQYSNHVLAGLQSHRGPILTVANWSGQWPGLVEMLNLNGSLAKSGVKFSTIWSQDFDDEFFRKGLRQWLQSHQICHDLSHVRSLDFSALPAEECSLGRALAHELKTKKAILKDIAPASDLVEGLLNNVERPPVFSKDGLELYAGAPLPHFNEVDECAGLDSLVTNRVWTAMHIDPATTLHDVLGGELYSDNGIDDFVWVFQISGALSPSHLVGGYTLTQTVIVVTNKQKKPILAQWMAIMAGLLHVDSGAPGNIEGTMRLRTVPRKGVIIR